MKQPKWSDVLPVVKQAIWPKERSPTDAPFAIVAGLGDRHASEIRASGYQRTPVVTLWRAGANSFRVIEPFAFHCPSEAKSWPEARMVLFFADGHEVARRMLPHAVRLHGGDSLMLCPRPDDAEEDNL